MPDIYGFTLLRNGVKYDYCFKESLLSLSPLCKSIYVALGDGSDNTCDILKDMSFLKIIPTIWDESLREGGLILSQQTNIALDAARQEHLKDGGWGFYLQCDEVLHEEDYQLIKRDIAEADRQGFDAIDFRYLHFWQNHNKLAINKKWYPQEIRAIKLDSEIESWGDAQGFRKFKKVYHSDANIFHYGHVRREESYREKKRDILKLYHPDDKIDKYKKREKRFDNITECINYYGNHAAVMRERVEHFGDCWELQEVASVNIVGDRDQFDSNFLKGINAKEVEWVSSVDEIPKSERKDAILTDPKFLNGIFYRSKIPEQMRSKLARPWTKEFILLLKLSEKKIGMKKNSNYSSNFSNI